MKADGSTRGDEDIGGPTDLLDIESSLFEEFKLERKHPGVSTHDLWVRRLPALVPTIMYNRKGHAKKVRMTNVSSRFASCPAHFPVLLWVPHDMLPQDEGYVRVKHRSIATSGCWHTSTLWTKIVQERAAFKRRLVA